MKVEFESGDLEGDITNGLGLSVKSVSWMEKNHKALNKALK